MSWVRLIRVLATLLKHEASLLINGSLVSPYSGFQQFQGRSLVVGSELCTLRFSLLFVTTAGSAHVVLSAPCTTLSGTSRSSQATGTARPAGFAPAAASKPGFPPHVCSHRWLLLERFVALASLLWSSSFLSVAGTSLASLEDVSSFFKISSPAVHHRASFFSAPYVPPATTAWKLPSFRCPLPQYEDFCSTTLYVALVWELRTSSFQGFDILLEWSTIIIFGSAQVHSLKVAKLLFLQPHLSLPHYASNGFMVAVRTGPSKLHGTKGCGDLVVGVFLFVGSSRRSFVAIALIADSLVVKAAPAGASFMDFRSPSVISDSECVLSVFYSKDVSITGLFGVMDASIGFLYASRLAIVAAVIWAMLALLSFMLSFLLNISSTAGV